MFINTYDFTVDKNGEAVDVSLRLGAGQQIKLKKKWNDEGTTTTLFNSIDDIERFVDVLDFSLKYTGNKNTIKTGSELYDLMAENGLLGMAKKQKIITSIALASGIFDEEEKESIDTQTAKSMEDAFKEKN